MSSKHTAIPWKFWDRKDPHECMITDDSGARGVCRMIARIFGQLVDAKKMRANARLIVRAVNAHEAMLTVLQCEEADDAHFNETIDRAAFHKVLVDAGWFGPGQETSSDFVARLRREAIDLATKGPTDA